jgi:hypothetical protein
VADYSFSVHALTVAFRSRCPTLLSCSRIGSHPIGDGISPAINGDQITKLGREIVNRSGRSKINLLTLYCFSFFLLAN